MCDPERGADPWATRVCSAGSIQSGLVQFKPVVVKGQAVLVHRPGLVKEVSPSVESVMMRSKDF